jgi:DNA mismatch repair protein MutS
MEGLFPRIKNYNVSVKELDNRVIFLRKLQRGGAAHSFGIHVARMAGMPQQVVTRADDMLEKLEAQRAVGNPKINTEQPIQMSIFQLDDPILTSLRNTLAQVNIEALSPLDAFDKLRELKKMVD